MAYKPKPLSAVRASPGYPSESWLHRSSPGTLLTHAGVGDLDWVLAVPSFSLAEPQLFGEIRELTSREKLLLSPFVLAVKTLDKSFDFSMPSFPHNWTNTVSKSCKAVMKIKYITTCKFTQQNSASQ